MMRESDKNGLDKLKAFNKRLEQIQLDASSIKEQFFIKDPSNVNLIVNNIGEIVDVGDGFKDIIGYEKKDIIGENFIDFVYKKDKIKTVDVFKNSYELNDDFVFRNRWICKDGSLIQLEWHQAIHKGNFIYASAKVIERNQ